MSLQTQAHSLIGSFAQQILTEQLWCTKVKIFFPSNLLTVLGVWGMPEAIITEMLGWLVKAHLFVHLETKRIRWLCKRCGQERQRVTRRTGSAVRRTWGVMRVRRLQRGLGRLKWRAWFVITQKCVCVITTLRMEWLISLAGGCSYKIGGGILWFHNW